MLPDQCRGRGRDCSVRSGSGWRESAARGVCLLVRNGHVGRNTLHEDLATDEWDLAARVVVVVREGGSGRAGLRWQGFFREVAACSCWASSSLTGR